MNARSSYTIIQLIYTIFFFCQFAKGKNMGMVFKGTAKCTIKSSVFHFYKIICEAVRQVQTAYIFFALQIEPQDTIIFIDISPHHASYEFGLMIALPHSQISFSSASIQSHCITRNALFIIVLDIANTVDKTENLYQHNDEAERISIIKMHQHRIKVFERMG